MSQISSPLRRRLLRFGVGSAALAVAGVTGLSALARELDDFVKGPPMPDIAPTRLSEHVWTLYSPDGFPTPENLGMMCNVSFVLTSKGVVVLDSGASVQIGEMALRQIRRLTDKPVIALFNSHYHGDHWLGNHAFVDAFGKDLPIHAHAHSKKEIEGIQGEQWRSLMEKWTNQATAGTRAVPPNRVVKHGDELAFGDVTLRIHDYGKAHTPGDICVEVLQDRLTHVGDVAMDRRIANMDDGSYVGSLRYFENLEQHAASILWLPGHGRAGPDVLKWNRELFEGIYQPCEAAVKAGQDMDTARAAVLADPRVAGKARDTQGFDANIGKYISLAYLEAESVVF